jgi:lysyl-tRNA synthetase class 2
MSPALTLKINLLRSRAQALAAARSFFAKRGVLEVDCNALVYKPPLDSNIDVMSVAVTLREVGYLHTSPEYAMKQLLCETAQDIYFLGHVYRQGEIGWRHNPEFTMAEWYRIGFSFDQMIEETCDFITLFTKPLPKRKLSFRKAFEYYVGINYSHDSIATLYDAAKRHAIDLSENALLWDRDTFLSLLLTHVIEPKLGQEELTILIDYPCSEAALACVVEKEGELVAERFEIYGNGLELANGYHELDDPIELRRRFTLKNEKRVEEGKEPYALDEQFLSSLSKGKFPPCCGVSVGFDRVLMLKYKLQTISEILLNPWASESLKSRSEINKK